MLLIKLHQDFSITTKDKRYENSYNGNRSSYSRLGRLYNLSYYSAKASAGDQAGHPGSTELFRAGSAQPASSRTEYFPGV